ncbi:MAG: TRAP transporter small permease subunit [Gammaproteobacteria bacterium]
MSWIERLIRALDALSDVTGKGVASLTLLMMALTCAVVTLRYVFNVGSIVLQESVMYMHGCVFMLAIPYALKVGAHVRVDIFYTRFSRRGRHVVDLIGSLAFLIPFALFVIWVSFDYVAASWRIGEASPEVGGVPYVYLLKTLIPVMAGALLLQGISEALKAAVGLLANDHAR